MSITPNCLDYLLAIAEKIINSSADQPTIQKYYALKERIMAKSNSQVTNSIVTLGTFDKENSKVDSGLRCSIALSSSKKSKRNNTILSKGKSRQKGGKVLQQGRVQTFASRKTLEKSSELQSGLQYSILVQIATILKNGEACPNILKTIKLSFNIYNQKLCSVIKSIQNSLKNIYASITKPITSQLTQLQTIQISQQTISSNQLLVDNRWLIGKLQNLIAQNSTLRRMVGKRIY